LERKNFILIKMHGKTTIKNEFTIFVKIKYLQTETE
jgi:hypothetical protein